jgi:hypothetical protein
MWTADRLIGLGVVVFALGALTTLATLGSALLGLGRLPVAAYLFSMAMPVGLGVALLGMLLGARQRRTPG